jgi:hypothetical protein
MLIEIPYHQLPKKVREVSYTLQEAQQLLDEYAALAPDLEELFTMIDTNWRFFNANPKDPKLKVLLRTLKRLMQQAEEQSL